MLPFRGILGMFILCSCHSGRMRRSDNIASFPPSPAGILDRSPECFDTEIFWQSSLELKLRHLHRVTELGRARGRLLETICATIGSPNEVKDDDQFGQTNSSGVNAG